MALTYKDSDQQDDHRDSGARSVGAWRSHTASVFSKGRNSTSAASATRKTSIFDISAKVQSVKGFDVKPKHNSLLVPYMKTTNFKVNKKTPTQIEEEKASKAAAES